MPLDRLNDALINHLEALNAQGTRKGDELVITGVLPAEEARGPRYTLEGEGDFTFLRMNSNSYLGLSQRPEILDAEDEASRKFGAGPGAVRFISGTFDVHRHLEARLAAFHGRSNGMIFSSAYATSLGVLAPLISHDTAVISDELNHNCIINAIRMARPGEKKIYRHTDMKGLEACLEEAAGICSRAIVVTDGIFSMRGDHAPLAEIMEIAERFDERFPENVVVVVDDSHGVGAFGATGRGTEEHTGAQADILIGTLGKAFGVNGGYVVGSETLTDYLRETAPLYIYSNPITPGEAGAALAAVDLVDSPTGHELLQHLGAVTRRFEKGLVKLGYGTLSGPHPVVPLMVRDTDRTTEMVMHLFDHGILATGLNFPVVPKGDESIRFQVSADHTAYDIDYTLEVLEMFPSRGK